MPQENYPHLFQPIRIGNFTVPNRIVHAPTDIFSANFDGSMNARTITYYEEIARGGCGFIIVGASTPDSKTGRPGLLSLSVDADPMIPGLAELNDAMKRHGAMTSLQVQHPGRQSSWPRYGLISATDMIVDIPASAGHEVVYAEEEAHGKSIRAMTVDEVYEYVEKFAEAAWRVQTAGYDSVQIHGAHGYLVAQFMSPYTNKRNDRFGGDFNGRMRFTWEIIKRIQHKCGKDFPIGMRYSGEEYIEGGRRLEESVRVARYFEDRGLAFLDISAGIFEIPGPTCDPMYYPEGWNTYTAEEIKKHVKIPVITSHSLRSPEVCDKIIAEGRADMVGFSRQLIADPYWANKAKAGKKEEIRKCISCLVGCWQESALAKHHMRCSINPAIGDERFLRFGPAAKACTVAVVGGGPAGMEAARIATLRGHKVTIFEKTSELGGAILQCCMVPGKNKMKWYADWIRRQVSKLGVEVRYESDPKPADLAKFDVVLVATGARAVRPKVPGVDGKNVVLAEDVLRCRLTNCEHYPKKGKAAPAQTGDTVLVWGDCFSAADAAEKIGLEGKKVIIVTEKKEFGEWMETSHKDVMLKRFKCGNGEGISTRTLSQPVTFIASTTVREIGADGQIQLENTSFERSTIKVDTVVLAKVEADDSLYQECVKAGLLVKKIGDVRKVHNLRGAVLDGTNIGLTLDADNQVNANGALVAGLPTELRV
jgi:2,4-dienoyl-CoA reductase-like NADH-dependent reductase (Old Yellow Enzyme family)/thioredoxin reductase